MKEDCLRLLRQINKSPSCYHAVENVCEELRQNGYRELSEAEPWRLEPKGKYFTVRNDSSVIAFRIPEGESCGFMMAAAHSDSPAFKLKENPERYGEAYVRLSAEKYGGMLMSTWLDRPLSVAGRLIVKENGELQTYLVNLNRDLVVIPNVAIHMNRDANEGMKYLANVDMLPLYGCGDCKKLLELLTEEYSIPVEAVFGKDLFLYCRAEGTIFGANEEFIAAPRLDDLMCVFGCLEGFVQSKTADVTPVLCIFDNEEVGSATKQGAASSFLRDVLRRIVLSCGGGEEKYLTMLSRSFMVSADNAHAVHPNHPEYADPNNSPYLNEGIVIKFNANQRYATDGRSGAVFRSICDEAGVETQVMSNRSDLPGGSTLGSIADTLVPVSTVDIGLPQLAMHSAYETAGTKDYSDLIRVMTEYFSFRI